jgi:hypothetical protein
MRNSHKGRPATRAYMTGTEVASRWRLPRQAVQALVNTGNLRAQLVGNTLLITPHEIKRFEKKKL